MKYFFLPVILCCFWARLAAEDVVVTAKISESGHTQDGHEAFVVQAEARNSSAIPVVIAMMKCSWSDSWHIDPKKDLTIPIWACDNNFPTEYTFPHGGGFSFQFLVESRETAAKIEGKQFKLGFICIKSPSAFWEMLTKSNGPVPIAWSRELTVPKISDRILVISEMRKGLPTQP